MKYSQKTIYNKARRVGYTVKSGFKHYMYNNAVHKDKRGERTVGYTLYRPDGYPVKECYDNIFDNLFTLEDVEKYLMDVYKDMGLEY